MKTTSQEKSRRRTAGLPYGNPPHSGFPDAPPRLQRRRWLHSITLLCGFAALPAFPVRAAASRSTGSSAGYGLSVDLSVAGIVMADSGEQGRSAGSAPPAYDVSTASGGVPVNLNAGLLLNATGNTASEAKSDLDGTGGTHTTSAAGEVNALAINVADTVLLPPLISLNAGLIRSECQISGTDDATTVTAGSTISDSALSISGIAVELPSDPAPNTVIEAAGGVAGITLFLNEQTPVSGSAGEEVTCNALRIQIRSVNILGIGLISGDIVTGHSTARQFADTDSDGIRDSQDGDDDGDGIPDVTETAQAGPEGDTDGDGVPNRRDLDSDNDGLNDVREGGGTDANGDGFQDGTADTNNNGLVDSVEPALGGTALPLPDTDGDGARDYVDLDSDNDAISDLVESGFGAADTTSDGVADGTDPEADGIAGGLDGLPEFGDANPPTVPDTDGDGIPNHLDPTSQGPGTRDIVQAGEVITDTNGDGMVDNPADNDDDGIADVVDDDDDTFGGLTPPPDDTDGDGIPNDDEGGGGTDTDGDSIPDSLDLDSDADGIPDAAEFTNAGSRRDTDGDGLVDWRDLDSDNDGINDVLEGGGADTNGDARQDGTADANANGLTDTVDPAQGGTPLTVADTDGDGARDYIDLDSDNDTVSDLLESGSGATDANFDGLVDGNDTDGDGIRNEVDRLVTFGDAQDSGAVNTDGADTPDYLDPDSDNAGGPDIDSTDNSDLDANGDGRVDAPYSDPERDGVDQRVDTLPDVFGGTGGCATSGAQWRRANFTGAEQNDPAVSGWDADPDHDGLTNAAEYVFGTNPKDHSSRAAAVPVFAADGFTLTIPRDECTRAFVSLEYSSDLQNWTVAGPASTVQETPSSVKIAVTGAAAGSPNRLFVRLRVVVP